MKTKIFYTNDIHSNYDNLIKLNTYIKNNKSKEDFLFDIGDLCDLKSVFVQGTRALGVHEVIEYMGYDAICVGNNEIDLEYKQLCNYSYMKTPIMSANLTDNQGNVVGNIIPSKILTKNNVRFLLIALSPFYGLGMKSGVYNVFYNMGNLNVSDPVPAINKELKKYEGMYDISILLSHSGIEAEKYIAENVNSIDIIIGGHSHTKIERPYKINNTIYTQAYCFGEYVGVLELEIENKKIIGYEGGLIQNTFESDEELLKIYKRQEKKAISNLSIPLYTVEKLSWSYDSENEITNFICDSLYYEHKCDFSFINAGIVDGHVEGEVSKMSLLKLSPSKLNPTRLPVLGRNFREAVELSLDNDFISQNGRGAGFRGKILGTLCYSHNVEIILDPLTIKINGELLDENKVYNCMSDDYLQRGNCYKSFKIDNKYCEFYNGYIRDLLERNLNNKVLIEECKIKRIM